MEFRNLTPFDALCFAALDVDDELQRVVAMKVVYKIVRESHGWRAEVMDEDPPPLCTADQHWGEPAHSSIAMESDLAPFKPKCDVIIKGASFAPGGKPAKSWPARIRITALEAAPVVQPEDVPRPQSLNPLMDLTAAQKAQWQSDKDKARKTADDINAAAAKRQAQTSVLVDKTLTISGKSEFMLGPLGGWRRSSPQPATEVALKWEHSFGGNSVVPDPKNSGAHLLNEVCYANPVGTGWVEKRFFDQLSKAKHKAPREIPAPQIEDPQTPLSEPVFVEHPKPSETELDAAAMAEVAKRYSHRPAGFGVVGRAWAPRLSRAGTYDDKWHKERYPKMPKDFDFSYWNGAPDDQQTPRWPQHVRIELWNLIDPKLSLNGQVDGHVSIELPQHRPFVLMRLEGGAMVPLSMETDTVVIDTKAMTISLTHRMRWPDAMPVRALEARFEIDPNAPLIKIAQAPKPQMQLTATSE
jgi:hypothetical protein